MKSTKAYLLFFMALSLIYFWKPVTEGMVLGGDVISQYYPMSSIIRDYYRSVSLPLWNPFIFLGFPILGAMQYGVLYPPNIFLKSTMALPLALSLTITFHIALSGFFTFLYARRIGLERFPSMAAGIIFAFMGFLMPHIQHIPILKTGAWLPLVLYLFEGLRQRPTIGRAALASLAVAVQLLAGHPQIFFYSNLVVGFYIIFGLFLSNTEHKGRFAALSLLALVVAAGIALPQLVSTFKLTGLSERGYMDYETFAQFSFQRYMVPTVLFPYLYGRGYAGAYWGPDLPGSLTECYIGVLPLILAVAAFIKYEKRIPLVRFWGVVAVAAFILSLGDSLRPLHQLMHHIPIYNSFRAPSRHWYEICFALSILFGFGLNGLTSRDDVGGSRSLKRNAILFIAFLVLSATLAFTLLSGYLLDIFSDMDLVRPDKAVETLSLASPGIYIPIILLITSAVVLMFNRKARLFKVLVVLLILTEVFMYRMPNSWISKKEVDGYYSGVFEFLSRDPDYRSAFITLNIENSQMAITHGISSIDGYDPLLYDDYERLMNMLYNGYSYDWAQMIGNNELLSMLNTKYLVLDDRYQDPVDVKGRKAKGPDGEDIFVPPFGIELPEGLDFAPVYRKAYASSDVTIYENLNVIPRAHAVTRLRAVGSIEELRVYLYAFQLDPWSEAAVSPDDLTEIGRTEFAPGTVNMTGYSDTDVTLEADFPAEGFIVLADRYYPGWKAYVNGTETKIFKTDGVLRGIRVPGGKSTVVFRYVPSWMYYSLAFGCVLLALTVLTAFVGRRP